MNSIKLANYNALLFLAFIPLFLLAACNGGKMPEKTISFTALKDVPESTWTKLSKKKIFFGHQSVGNNIIAGIKDLLKENPQIKLNIVNTNKSTDFDTPLFAHSSVGKNEDPRSKIRAFADFLNKGLGNKAHIAFFKFCFVDITADTDAEKVFTEYRNSMSRLQKQYPNTTFVHVTVPLTSKLTGINGLIKKTKDLVKKLIGRPVYGCHDNMKRSQFNEMLRKEYVGKEALFDLEKIESTFPDGKRASFTKDKKTYYSLVPAYTHDGGHLNETGRKKVASQLLLLLTGLCK